MSKFDKAWSALYIKYPEMKERVYGESNTDDDLKRIESCMSINHEYILNATALKQNMKELCATNNDSFRTAIKQNL